MLTLKNFLLSTGIVPIGGHPGIKRIVEDLRHCVFWEATAGTSAKFLLAQQISNILIRKTSSRIVLESKPNYLGFFFINNCWFMSIT